MVSDTFAGAFDSVIRAKELTCLASDEQYDASKKTRAQPRIAEDVGGGVRISVLPAGETDYDVWCAACGEFLHHGLSCDCSSSADREPASGPSISLRDAPSIRALWS